MSVFIYKITNTINDKVYVGQTASKPNKRWSKHKCDLRKRKHCNLHLQSAWNKYGETSFVFEVIEQFDSEMNFDLNNLERYWIKHYDSMNPKKGYNKTEGGDGCIGYKHTQEHKDYISKKLKGRIFSDEHKRRLSVSLIGHDNGWTGRNHSNETKLKISKSKLGKQRTLSSCEKQSLSTKGKSQPSKRKTVKGKNLMTSQEVVFESQKAAASFIECDYQLISRICTGRMKSTKGWSFSFMDEAA